jgi:hypothetical protein
MSVQTPASREMVFLDPLTLPGLFVSAFRKGTEYVIRQGHLP